MAEATRPVAIGPRLAELSSAYPAADDVLGAATEGRRERAILARLWISEGIPFAFRGCPWLYEDFRTSIAERLGIDAKQISIAGSGRLGYSLAPKKWGEAYRPNSSDLDWFAVSDTLFERLCENFRRWCADYVSGEVEPNSEMERYYWAKNREETPGRIERGFVDSYRVPNWRQYGAFLAANRCLEELSVKLRRHDEAPKPPGRLTLRCYRDWRAYERQMTISLRAVIEERGRFASAE